MPNNDGTLIIAPVRPQATADTYPSAYAGELLGGHHAAALLTDRDAIPPERREEGMACWVVETATLYILSGGVLNANWTAFSGGGGAPTTFVFTQAIPAAVWVIDHGLGQFPAIDVVDSSGRIVEGDVVYDSSNQMTVTFIAPFAGLAYLN